ncbi:IclR family transcriptional regulator [Agrilactobacillus yilanensis]|uniref:IclR family transcriptional regulator n=1 Tax=Agrilactobacillus yilanensis TaxID=2485997 RepID=A0ABW4J390_9LACO|nr:IclR family transcriptional regulator [Agrilactobacillus yilanensis]
MENKSIYGGVLLKAKNIMDFIMTCETPPILTEISRNTAMNKSTVLKILHTLELCGYVRCTGPEKRYSLGTVFLGYSQSVLSTFNIKSLAEPYLTTLRDNTNETINLGILQNQSAVLLSKLESPSAIKLYSDIGKGLRLYTSAIGKSLLSTFNQDEFENYLNTTELEQITPNTITNKAELIQDIEVARKRGYAIENCENQPDVICVGFPIVRSGRTYGAFSISAPKYRVKTTDLENFIKYGKIAQSKIIAAL